MVIEIYKAPMPERDSVVGAMRRMRVGETFMVPVKSANTRRGLYATATVAGIKIKTVVREGKIQVWRVPGREPKPRGHKLSHDETKVAMGVEPEVDDIEDEFALPELAIAEYDPEEDEWEDIGVQWNEALGEQVETQRHCRNQSKFRVKPGSSYVS